jgi:hypothetical protein
LSRPPTRATLAIILQRFQTQTSLAEFETLKLGLVEDLITGKVRVVRD